MHFSKIQNGVKQIYFTKSVLEKIAFNAKKISNFVRFDLICYLYITIMIKKWKMIEKSDRIRENLFSQQKKENFFSEFEMSELCESTVKVY